MAISNKLPCWFPTLLSTNGISRCLSLTVMSNQNFWSSRHFRCKQQMTGQNRFLGFCSFMFPFDIGFHFLKSECERVFFYQLVDTANQNQTVGQFRTPYCCDMKRDIILYPAIQSDRRDYRLHNPKIPVRASTTFKSFQTGMGPNWAFSAYIGLENPNNGNYEN